MARRVQASLPRNTPLLVVGMTAGILLGGWGIYAIVFNNRILLENNSVVRVDADVENWRPSAR